MAINYASESQRLAAFVPESSSEFWKPKPGQFKVKAMTEIEETEPFKGEVDKPRAKLTILLDDKQYIWTFGVGKTSSSTYGQLVNLAQALGGSLLKKEFMVVVVSGKGKKGEDKNTYTIVKL